MNQFVGCLVCVWLHGNDADAMWQICVYEKKYRDGKRFSFRGREDNNVDLVRYGVEFVV